VLYDAGVAPQYLWLRLRLVQVEMRAQQQGEEHRPFSTQKGLM
jgi:hypothetical protein